MVGGRSHPREQGELVAAQRHRESQLVAVRALEGPVLHRELHIIKRRNHGLSPAATALVEQFAPIIAALETIEGIEVLLDARAVQRFLQG